MPDPKPQPNTGAQVVGGFEALKQLVKQSQQGQQAQGLPPATGGVPPPAPPSGLPVGPPAIDTGSIAGLLGSLKDRLSYAMFGPSTTTPPAPAPPVKR